LSRSGLRVRRPLSLRDAGARANRDVGRSKRRSVQLGFADPPKICGELAEGEGLGIRSSRFANSRNIFGNSKRPIRSIRSKPEVQVQNRYSALRARAHLIRAIADTSQRPRSIIDRPADLHDALTFRESYSRSGGQGFMKSNGTKRRIRWKSRSLSVTRTHPASRHDKASRTSLPNAFETRAISHPCCLAISASRSPERCQASADGVTVRPARS
jgi:hypothetical protein